MATKDKRSLMKQMKKGFKSIRSKSKNKQQPKSRTPGSTPRGHATKIGGVQWSEESVDSAFSEAATASSWDKGSQSLTRKGSMFHTFTKSPPLVPRIENSVSHSSSFQTDMLIPTPSSKRKKHRKALSLGLGLSKTSTQKLKSSTKNNTLEFNVPQLYINKRPETVRNVQYPEEFGHLLENEDGIQDKVLIPINIDIEKVYNEMYDNNYNRKLLGPLKPVRFAIVIACEPEEEELFYDDDEYAHIEDVDCEYPNAFSSDDEDMHDLYSATPMTIQSDDASPNKRRKHAKSKSIPTAPPAHLLKSAAVPIKENKSAGDTQPTPSPSPGGDAPFVPSQAPQTGMKVRSQTMREYSTQDKRDSAPPSHINPKRKALVKNSMKPKPKALPRAIPPKPAAGATGATSANSSRTGKRRQVRVHKRGVHDSTMKQQQQQQHTDEDHRKPLKFENKYGKVRRITPDELEILARKLLNVTPLNEESDEEESNPSMGIRGQHGRRNSFNYIHPKTRIKRGQHNHLLHSNVSRKAESVSFGLQLINSIKHITSNLTHLMETFSDGLNDLLRICQQFMDLIVDPLPRQVFNDYADKIGEYEQLVQMIDEMSSSFYDSSQNLRDNLPGLADMLQSDVSQRVNEYEQYMEDLKSADNDIKSLHVHCDRSIRRLFREIPRPMLADIDDNDADGDEPGLNRQKSVIQHRNIRVFGTHYVAANSNEHICRAVPSTVRSGIVQHYIHYLTLMDTMNHNIRQCYHEVLPQINSEFEGSQGVIKQHITQNIQSVNANISQCFNTNPPKKKPTQRPQHNDKFHRYNSNKPQIKFSSAARNARVRVSSSYRKPLAPIKPYELYSNGMMASPMHVNDVITKIDEYVNEEHEKKTYDEFEMVQITKKKFKDRQIQEHGYFSLKNYRSQFDSAHFINEEVIQNFFTNHYYHLGDILFEIPDLYEAFENYLVAKLCVENLYFLRAIDDIYFNLAVQYNHAVAVQEAKDIYHKFIAEDCEYQINLPGNVSKKIHKDLKRINKLTDPISIFDKAYECISSLIHKESLPNFYKSLHFKNWYEKQRAQNEKQFKKEKKMIKKT